MQGRVGLAFATGDPEENQFEVGAPDGDKAEEREQHGIDEQCKVLKSGLAGLFQASNITTATITISKNIGIRSLKTIRRRPKKSGRTRTISSGRKLYWNWFPR